MSLEKLCRLFGYSRQAYWKSWRRREGVVLDESALVVEIRRIRRRMPRIGGRKLQVMLQAQGHDIGRDRLFALLRESGLRNRISRYRAVTTNSRHWMRKWPNLVAGQEIVRMNQVWVSDITYIDVYHRGKRHWLYLSLVTDACTHEILGWTVHETLDTAGPRHALEMALSRFLPGSLSGLIHHSDRGAQYCSSEYVGILKSNGILISMTEGGDPYQNAIAERVNGILKTEWLHGMRFTSDAQARAQVERIIGIYNNERPHMSIGLLSPAMARAMNAPALKIWKKRHAKPSARKCMGTMADSVP